MRPSQVSVIQRTCACGGIGGAASGFKHGRDEELSARSSPTPAAAVTASAAREAVAAARRGGGRALDERTRAEMEARLGGDFSAVRIHTDEAAARSAAGVHARAYTVGDAIVFGAGAYQPGISDGRRTLAHELVHVQQQARGTMPGTDLRGGIAVSEPGDAFEREAEARASGSERAPYSEPAGDGSRAAPAIQRQSEPPKTAADGSQPVPDSVAPIGAPPMIEEELEPEAEPASGPPAMIARQAQSSTGSATRGAAAGFTCQTVTWRDYPPANPAGVPYDALTGFLWSRRGNQFSARFNPRTSWVRPKWRTDTSAASMALLRHEQYHLRLVCLLAAKATTAATAGTPVATVAGQMRTAVARYTVAYDDDTQHGTNANLQNKWVADIDAGVVQFPFASAP